MSHSDWQARRHFAPIGFGEFIRPTHYLDFPFMGGSMNTPIAYLFDIVITPWKLVGYLGVFLFAGRWVVQMLATRRHGRPVFPGLFWTMSVLGSALLLVYFIWGKNDSVGVLSNLFPMAVALYNFSMHYRSSSSQAPSHA
jgi:lipid-A-disaccharide synthase-like uncharacterized protein